MKGCMKKNDSCSNRKFPSYVWALIEDRGILHWIFLSLDKNDLKKDETMNSETN